MSKYNLKASESTPKAKAKRIATPKADAAEPVKIVQATTPTATPAQEQSTDAARIEDARQGISPFTLKDYRSMRDRGGPLTFARW